MYRTKDQVASEFIAEGRRRGITPRGIVICIATGLVESNLTVYANAKVPESLALPHDAVGSDGRSVGPLQQQVVMGIGWWWGDARTCMDPTLSAGLFYDRLARLDYNHGDSGVHAQTVQQSSFPDRYITRMAEAQRIYDRLANDQPAQENPMAVSGDPIWLEDVLREALGDRLVVEPGWKDRGAGGTMGVIWGTMIHHTGNVNERVEIIRDGVQQPSGWLPGPLSQGLIKPDGTFHLIAVGPCNHAGGGSYGTLANGNGSAIGFECSYNGSGPWPQKQIITMRDATAAISRKIGKRAADSVCGHKEYAKPQGRKVDPGNLDMDWFRGEVQKDLDGFVFPGEQLATVPPVVAPPTQPVGLPTSLTDRQLLEEIWTQLRGPATLEGGRGWPQLGGRSLVDGLAELLPDEATK